MTQNNKEARSSRGMSSGCTRQARACGWTTSPGPARPGWLEGYVAEDSVTVLTCNPTIFDKAIEGGWAYGTEIATAGQPALSDEEVLFDLALTDLLGGITSKHEQLTRGSRGRARPHQCDGSPRFRVRRPWGNTGGKRSRRAP